MLRYPARPPVTTDDLPTLRRYPRALTPLPPLFPAPCLGLCSGVAAQRSLPQLKSHASSQASPLSSSVALLNPGVLYVLLVFVVGFPSPCTLYIARSLCFVCCIKKGLWKEEKQESF